MADERLGWGPRRARAVRRSPPRARARRDGRRGRRGPRERHGCHRRGALAPADRSAILRRTAARVRDRGDELARLIALESGKPIREARGEVARTALVLEEAAEEARRITGHLVPVDAVAGSVLLGRVVVDTIVEKLNGQDVPAEGYLKPQEITKDNLDSFDRTILYPPQ